MNFLLGGDLTPPPNYTGSNTDALAAFFLFSSIALVIILVIIGVGLGIDRIIKKRKKRRKKNEEQTYLEKGTQASDPTELDE